MAVVIRAPDVDTAGKAALLKFVAVVGNVGKKVSGVAILAPENLVLFSSEFSGFIPKSALALIGKAFIL